MLPPQTISHSYRFACLRDFARVVLAVCELSCEISPTLYMVSAVYPYRDWHPHSHFDIWITCLAWVYHIGLSTLPLTTTALVLLRIMNIAARELQMLLQHHIHHRKAMVFFIIGPSKEGLADSLRRHWTGKSKREKKREVEVSVTAFNCVACLLKAPCKQLTSALACHRLGIFVFQGRL